RMQSELIEGQVLDIQYSKKPIKSINEEQIMKVMWKKTGALYEFAGKAGAMLGLNTLDAQHPFVQAISSFTGKCGTAFQLQDDILGIVGDENKLGKPVGSDIKEGKRTIIISHAFMNASDKQKRKLSKIIGNQKASEDEINEAKNLLIELGSIDWTKKLAEKYIKDSLKYLDIIPQSKYKELLLLWADYMVHRKI
ncbi:MAG: polyprenyl synthetase family protein, partial [Candidatus Poribacteria bacterium]